MYVSDPFQSYYHMGLDVRHLTEAGVDFFTANIVPTMATMNNPARPFLFHRYMTIAPAMKALSGNGTLYLMLGVRDDAEEWDAVHHAPNQLERDIYTAFAYRTVTKDGVRRCIEKPFVTLGEGLEAEDWKTVNRYLDIAYSLDAEKVVSPLLYWSDRAHNSMLREYIRTRRRSVCKILAELQARGAFCGGVVRGDALSACSGPLLVPNFDLLPEDEVRDLVRYEGPVMGIVPADYDLTPLGVPAAEFRDRFSAYPMKAFLLHADPVTDPAPYEELLRTDDGAPDLTEASLDLDDDRDVMDYEMWFCKMTGGFLDACAMLFRHMDGLGNPFSCNTPLLVDRKSVV